MYQNSAGDKWQAMGTTKVIQAIKKYPKEITTYEPCSNSNTPTLYSSYGTCEGDDFEWVRGSCVCAAGSSQFAVCRGEAGRED